MLSFKTLYVAAVIALLPLPAVSGAPWIQTEVTDDGITIYSRESEYENLRELMAEWRIKNSAYKVFKSAMSMETYRDLNKYLIDYRMTKTANPHAWYCYQRVSFPLIKDRDYTLYQESKEDPANGAYSISWIIDNDKGPPPQKDVIRVAVSRGAVTVTSDKNSNNVLLNYQIMFDPGGAVPKWLVNYVNKQTLPDILRVIKKNSFIQQEK
ncbi:MAG: hypothetical protein JW943_05845 [Deltaproteobacteria bacterium]|nr:hypothetical protein [Deltaproteobacteria bacterium]